MTALGVDHLQPVHGTGAGSGAWLLPALVAAVPSVLYLLGVARLRLHRGRPWSRLRTLSWLTGAVLLAVALSPPVASRHGDPVVHMAQHLLIGMYAPLALVLAAPVTLLLGVTPAPVGRRIGAVLRHPAVHVLSHPVTAAALATGGLVVLYGTPLYGLSTRSTVVHAFVTGHLLAAGLLFSWAVAGPDPAPRRPGIPTRVGVLVVSAAAHAAGAKLLYARAGRLPPGTTSPSTRWETAAQWMYYGGDLAELLLAAALFALWYRRGLRSEPRRSRHPVPLGENRTWDP